MLSKRYKQPFQQTQLNCNCEGRSQDRELVIHPSKALQLFKKPKNIHESGRYNLNKTVDLSTTSKKSLKQFKQLTTLRQTNEPSSCFIQSTKTTFNSKCQTHWNANCDVQHECPAKNYKATVKTSTTECNKEEEVNGRQNINRNQHLQLQLTLKDKNKYLFNKQKSIIDKENQKDKIYHHLGVNQSLYKNKFTKEPSRVEDNALNFYSQRNVSQGSHLKEELLITFNYSSSIFSNKYNKQNRNSEYPGFQQFNFKRTESVHDEESIDMSEVISNAVDFSDDESVDLKSTDESSRLEDLLKTFKNKWSANHHV